VRDEGAIAAPLWDGPVLEMQLQVGNFLIVRHLQETAALQFG
jgi:hypothetical protein